MKPSISALAICAFVAGFGSPVIAQSFFGGGVVAYDPQISTVQSGAILDAQPVVSADRRYVTITTRGQDSRLLALRDFQIAPPLTNGFVGGVTPNGAGAGGAGGAGGGGGFAATDDAAAKPPSNFHSRERAGQTAAAPSPPSPIEIERKAIAARSILARQGMFLLAPSS